MTNKTALAAASCNCPAPLFSVNKLCLQPEMGDMMKGFSADHIDPHSSQVPYTGWCITLRGGIRIMLTNFGLKDNAYTTRCCVAL